MSGEGPPRRVLVTGGCGFIGGHLVRALCEAGIEVVVLDDLSTGDADVLTGLDVELVEGTVEDAGLVARLTRPCDAVVHLAAQASVAASVAAPRATTEVNVMGTLNVLEAARVDRPRHVVFASSAAVYGPAPPVPAAETLPPAPVSPYAASKLAGEQYVLAYGAAYGMPVLPLRFFNVFGPGQRADHVYAAVVPSFLDAVRAGRALVVHGDGGQTRDFTYVSSVVDVILTAVQGTVATTTPVNLAFGQRRSLLQLMEEVESVVGHAVEVTFGPARPGDVRHSGGDASMLQTLFPHVEPPDLRTGLAATWAWVRSQAAPSG